MTTTNTPQHQHESGDNLNLNTDHPISRPISPMDSGSKVWEEEFQYLFDRAVDAFETGVRDPDQMFSDEDKSFLQSIGASPQEIFDFVEDWAEDGEPTPEVVREITGLRREYFLKVQKAQLGSTPMDSNGLPSPWASLGGHQWLPRIIAKARAKLQGELPRHIMYGCGRDRPFLQERNIGLPEFLKVVWEAGVNDEIILHYVDQKAQGNDPAQNTKAFTPSNNSQ